MPTWTTCEWIRSNVSDDDVDRIEAALDVQLPKRLVAGEGTGFPDKTHSVRACGPKATIGNRAEAQFAEASVAGGLLLK